MLKSSKCFIQDPIHIGTKFRNRSLRPSGLLPLGNKQISIAHMKMLINDVPKAIHGLVYSDFCPLDRQNFGSLQKCMDIRVRDALVTHIPDSEATSFYFQLCHEITTSFMDFNLMPLERIELIFHAVYFLRIWRKWLLSSKYTLRDNFITPNAYICTELNAENLLRVLRRCRQNDRPELFVPPLFSSQPCESSFRQFRSMSTVNYTKINFTLFELLHMIGRLEVQSDLLYTKLPALGIPLPKLESKNASQKTKIYALPSDDEIERCIERAKRSAMDDASNFGIHTDQSDIQAPAIPIAKLNSDIDIENNSDDENDLDESHQNEDDDDQSVSFHHEVEEMLDSKEESIYVTMT